MSKVTVKGVAYDLPEDLTFGESCDIESVTGQPLGGANGFRRTAALVWIAMRRRDKSMTWEQVRELNWTDVQWEKDKPQEDEAVPPAQTAEHDEPQGSAI